MRFRSKIDNRLSSALLSREQTCVTSGVYSNNTPSNTSGTLNTYLDLHNASFNVFIFFTSFLFYNSMKPTNTFPLWRFRLWAFSIIKYLFVNRVSVAIFCDDFKSSFNFPCWENFIKSNITFEFWGVNILRFCSIIFIAIF